VERHVFKGDRSEVRNAAVEAALTLAKKALKE
jgi:nicotinamide mononucleotide (NMN) deamidase PncC